MDKVRINEPAQIIALIPELIGKLPHNCLVALATKCGANWAKWSQSLPEHQRAIGPMMTIQLDGLLEDIPEHSCDCDGTECDSPIFERLATIGASIDRFADNFHCSELVMVWYCDDLTEFKRQEFLYSGFETLVDVLRDPHRRGGNDAPLIDSTGYATDYRQWFDTCDGELHSYADIALKSADAKKVATHGFSQVGVARIVDDAMRQAQARANSKMLSKVREGITDNDAATASGATQWNRTLQRLEKSGDYKEAVGSPLRVGKLIAQLQQQNVRDRIVLYAVNPRIKNITGISKKHVLAGMREATAIVPNPQRLKAVIGLCAYLAIFAEESCALPYAMCAYLEWWLGEGTSAFDSAQKALVIDPQCSMAQLVSYAISVQLPPPWVDSIESECE